MDGLMGKKAMSPIMVVFIFWRILISGVTAGEGEVIRACWGGGYSVCAWP